jgi:hypothetical protein
MSVPDEGYSNLLTMSVPDDGYSNLLTMSVPDDGYSNLLTMSVPDDGYSNLLTMSIPDDDYPRNKLMVCAKLYIYVLLLLKYTHSSWLLTSKYIYFILPLFCYDMNMNSLDCLLL